jgi:hypothetical protein
LRPPGAARPPLGYYAHDLRDHIAGAPHDHGIAAPHILALDLVHVVQRRVADHDAGHDAPVPAAPPV